MDEGKILIVNISRGKIGEDGSRLLGALLVTKIQLAAMSRVDIPEDQRKDFYLYVDEFQHFATESFANILSEARKFRLNLVMAHQYIKQMDEKVMDAVFGNVGTIVSFRVGADDGEFLEKWFQPDFMMNDIVNLGKYNIYIKLMIDGVSSKGFSASTIPPLPKLENSNREEIIDFSRKTYANPREKVEKDVAEWVGMREAESKPQAPMQEAYGSVPPPRSAPPRYSTSGNNEQPQRNNYNTYERRDEGRDDRRREERREEQRPSFGQQPRAYQNGNGHNGSQPRPQNNNNQPRPDFRPQNGYQPQPAARPPQYPKPENMKQETPKQQLQPQPQPHRSGISLDQALKTGPVNFHGRRIEEKREKAKVEVDTNELRRVLEEAMKNKE
jgi:hypothetical protein